MPHLVIELTENTRLTCSQEELLDEANAALGAAASFAASRLRQAG